MDWTRSGLRVNLIRVGPLTFDGCLCTIIVQFHAICVFHVLVVLVALSMLSYVQEDEGIVAKLCLKGTLGNFLEVLGLCRFGNDLHFKSRAFVCWKFFTFHVFNIFGSIRQMLTFLWENSYSKTTDV